MARRKKPAAGPSRAAGAPVKRIRQLMEAGDAAQALKLLETSHEGGLPPPSVRALHCRLLLRGGELDRAANLLSSAGGDAEAVTAMAELAMALLNAGQGAAARPWLERVTPLRPEHPELWQALAAARAATGDTAGAAQAWAELTRRGATSTPLAVQMARSFWQRGLVTDAGTWMRHAAEGCGDDAMALGQIGAEARLMGCFTVAAELLGRAVALNPDEPLLGVEYGAALIRNGDHEAARETLQAAAGACPQVAEAHFLLGEAEQACNDLDAAAAAFERALAIQPGMPAAEGNLAIVRLEQGRFEDALPLLDRRIASDRTPTRGLSMKAIALQAMGRGEEADRLLALDRRMRTCELASGEPGLDVAAFNQRLAGYLQQHRSLRESPDQHATRNGLHSGELFEDSNAELQTLKRWFEHEVSRYAAELAPDTDAFVRARPAHWSLTGWCVVLSDGGHQIPHIHTAAWLSGVYYVQLPDELDDDPQRREGWLEFGIPDARRHFVDDTRLTPVKPHVGLLVLFPACVHHRTVPIAHPGRPRISIAFDVVPR